jgi:hypothetical protein
LKLGAFEVQGFPNVDLSKCKKILHEIHKKRRPISGGSGRRARYEMRETILYFKLGRVLLSFLDSHNGGPNERSAFLSRIIIKLQAEFDDSENIFRWSIRFVHAFQNEEYFNKVSRLCNYSFGQLREVVEILGKDNPLGISQEDLKSFKRELAQEITYEKMRSLCMILKAKYVAEWKYQINSADLQDLFDRVYGHIQGIIDVDRLTLRSEMREKLSLKSITTLRHLLLLLSREATFESVSRQKPEVIRAINRRTKIRDKEMLELYEILLKFLKGGHSARERLRKIIKPVEMGRLQTMLKALSTEEDYTSFRKTEDMMKRINF